MSFCGKKEGSFYLVLFYLESFVGAIIRLGMVLDIMFKNIATLAVPFDAYQDFVLCKTTLLTGAFGMIGWTTGIDIFRTIKECAARYFLVPET